MKKSAFAIILLMVFPLIITGCATNVGQATPKTQQDEKVNTVGSSNNQHIGASEEKLLTVTSTVDFSSNYNSVEKLVSKSTVIVQGEVVG